MFDGKIPQTIMNLIELNEQIQTEEQAVNYFESIRWGAIPKCAHCDSEDVSPMQKDFRRKCYGCDKMHSVTVNTHLHNTKLPLKTWLCAISIISDAKKGLSARQLQRNIGVSYETAWLMYHKIRKLMHRYVELTGVVEMDETYVGGKPRKGRGQDKINLRDEEIAEFDRAAKIYKYEFPELKEGDYKKPYTQKPHKRGRGTEKIPIVGMVSRKGEVIAEVMRETTKKNLKAMVKKHVDEERSLLITDSFSGYNRFDEFIRHLQVDHHRMFSYKGINTNSIESFWAIIKRGIIGQYHQVSPEHLPNYITEFVFKYNNRNNENIFEELVRSTMQKV